MPAAASAGQGHARTAAHWHALCAHPESVAVKATVISGWAVAVGTL